METANQYTKPHLRGKLQFGPLCSFATKASTRACVETLDMQHYSSSDEPSLDGNLLEDQLTNNQETQQNSSLVSLNGTEPTVPSEYSNHQQSELNNNTRKNAGIAPKHHCFVITTHRT